MNVSHIFRKDPSNIGDWYCPPFRYFSLGNQDGIDLFKFKKDTPLNEHVIVGGGGLIAHSFRKDMEFLASKRSGLKSLIAWGLGESLVNDRDGGVVQAYTGALPDYLKQFDLIGIRDYGLGFEWVPCVSCMSPLFDIDYEIKHEVVFYEHKRIEMVGKAGPTHSNSGKNIEAAIKFLGSGQYVVTNSYHGAYWATLLGRHVIVIPNMSKMHRFKHAPALCAPGDWRAALDRAPTYPEALAECRKANIDFHAKVIDRIGG